MVTGNIAARARAVKVVLSLNDTMMSEDVRIAIEMLLLC